MTLLIASAILLSNQIPETSTNTAATTQAGGKVILRIATTTSLDATGLLNALKDRFEQKYPNVNVTWVAVGTGQAIEIGKRGDADLIIVHNRPIEDQFLQGGYGVHGITFAQNDFVILGPESDPVNVNSSKDVVEAFERIYQAGEAGKAVFVSRGDRSGTNLKELDIWKAAGLNATGKAWYVEAGQGMGQTLIMANEKQAYTLCDRSTFTSMKESVSLKILFEGDQRLMNFYRAILVNPEKFPHVEYDVAEKFVLFLVSEEGQNLIGNYKKGGQRLFNPIFGKIGLFGVNDPYESSQVEYWRSRLKG
ncbi:MAG: substrate-binding domain-containing protein [Nitrososphaeria archaeon]|nr:substrate-binding domain-containing protein [Nitrososphaeria archaeon]